MDVAFSAVAALKLPIVAEIKAAVDAVAMTSSMSCAKVIAVVKSDGDWRSET